MKGKSKKKRGKKPKNASGASFQLLKYIPEPFDHDALKADLVAEGLEAESRVPVLINSLLERFRDNHPLQIIATVAHGSQHTATDKGVKEQPLINNILPHHVELLQALALTLPFREWGRNPATPDAIQGSIDAVVDLAASFLHRRAIALHQARGEQEHAVLLLQERMRAHTQIVRNWDYMSPMVRLSTELYGSLDPDFRVTHGFGATDVVVVSDALREVLEKRVNERFKLLRKIFGARDKLTLVRRYYSLNRDVKGDPEEFIRTIPESATLEMVMSRLLAHADLALAQQVVVDVDELSAVTERSSEVVRLVLHKLSLQPGDLKADQIEDYFLENPVWTAPGMEVSGQFFFPMPQGVFSHIHTLMRSLATEAGVEGRLQMRRAKFLERKIEEIVTGVFPSTDFTTNAQWTLNGRRFETDLIGQVDSAAVVIEAKSAALTAQGLRGAPDRVRRHVRDLVVAPAEQSLRLEQVIWQAKAGDSASLTVTSSLGLEPDKIDTVVRISVTLDDFSIISSAEPELTTAGWLPPDLRLPPTLSVANLRCVAEILCEPIYFLHYFAERGRIQKTTRLIGDEVDCLGLYLETGFNIVSVEDEDPYLVISGISHLVDNFYMSAEAGVKLDRPRPKVYPQLERVIRQLQSKAPEGWLTIGLDLLRIGDVEEQKRIFRVVEKLRKRVVKTYLDPAHPDSVVVTPQAHREVCIAFYVFTEKLAEKRYTNVEQLAGNAMAEHGSKRCIVVARKIEAWDRPYEFVGIVRGDAQSAGGASP